MPAVLRFGALVWLVACWTGKSGAPAVESAGETGTHDVTGSYWCSFTESEYDDERQPCIIKKVGDKIVLTRLAGPERIRGQVTLDKNEGFAFAGELYCPWGDCSQSELHGRFKPVGRGAFKGTFREDGIVIHLAPARGAFGGAGYGGDTYGEADEDGMYGGLGYGRPRNVPRIDSRGRRRR